jgi:hypothetical protein
VTLPCTWSFWESSGGTDTPSSGCLRLGSTGERQQFPFWAEARVLWRRSPSQKVPSVTSLYTNGSIAHHPISPVPRDIRLVEAVTSLGLALESKKTRAVREEVIARVRTRVAALVEELEVAWVDREGLVRVRPDDVAVADVIRPGRTRVRLAGERLALRCCLRRPCAAEAGRRERAEETAVRTLSLDDHQVLVLALDGVHLNGLEQVARRVRHDDRAGRAEAAGEVADRHARAVDFAVVAGEEQVHVRAVADERLVDGARAGTGDRAREQCVRAGPPVRVRRVRRRLVAERRWAPLIREDPDALRRKVEDRRRDRRRSHTGLGGGAHLGPVAEEAEGH